MFCSPSKNVDYDEFILASSEMLWSLLLDGLQDIGLGQTAKQLLFLGTVFQDLFKTARRVVPI